MIPKFRAWVKPGVLSNHPDGVVAEAKPNFKKCLVKRDDLKGKKCFTEIFDFEDIEFMQSTEFPDKEGNEIWHKDILDESYINPMTGELVVVRYIVEKENGMWKLKDFKGRQQYDRYLFMRNGQCTRIGNIYENPDLLEVEG